MISFLLYLVNLQIVYLSLIMLCGTTFECLVLFEQFILSEHRISQDTGLFLLCTYSWSTNFSIVKWSAVHVYTL